MLALAIPLGSSVVIGDEKFRIKEILGVKECVLEDEEGISYTLTDDRAEEVRPEVFVSVGLNQSMTTAKLSFDAPRSIAISRE